MTPGSPVREPLPYPHMRGPHSSGFPPACSVPEHPANGTNVSPQCPGCRALLMAVAVAQPHRTNVSTFTGVRRSAVQACRELFDPLDPMMVLFERELARRGIA